MLIYPLRTTLGVSIHLLINIAVGIAITWWMRGFGNLGALWCIVPALVLLFIFGLALATLAGICNVYFRDTKHICEVAMPLLFYATPVMYQSRLLQGTPVAWLLDINPLALFLQMIRLPVVDGTVPPWSAFAAVTVTALGTALLAAICLARVQGRLIFAL
jgi:ABC-type polysaccharide/polyol phosphate export permease